MADLVVRNLDRHLVDTLERRASAHGRGAEAEHRLILERALFSPPKRNLAELLAAMPDLGRDSDFERSEGGETPNDVFR